MTYLSNQYQESKQKFRNSDDIQEEKVTELLKGWVKDSFHDKEYDDAVDFSHFYSSTYCLTIFL